MRRWRNGDMVATMEKEEKNVGKHILVNGVLNTPASATAREMLR